MAKKKKKKVNEETSEETVETKVEGATLEMSAESTVDTESEETIDLTLEATEETTEKTTVEITEEVILEVQAEELVSENTIESNTTLVAGDLVTDINEIEAAVCALVFASPVALSTRRLKSLLTHAGYDISQLDLVMESLAQSFEQKGIQLLKVSGGYQLRTNPKYGDIVQKLIEEKPQRLSKSALEVLAIVAYKQPIIRADIDHVRGTDSGHLLKSLLEKNLVRTEGHKESPGRPLLYGTTPYFLEVFSLGSLDDLPAIEDFERELKDADSDGNVLEADPSFFADSSGLDAEADRGTYDAREEEESDRPDFGEVERAIEAVEALEETLEETH